MRRLALALSIVTLSGCVIGDRHVVLGPVEGAPLAAKVAGRSVAIAVSDAREAELKPVVGHTKNGYGVKMAVVTSDQSPTTWVEECLAADLKRCGFTVAGAGGPAADVQIRVDLAVCYAQSYMRYGGEVAADVTVTSGGRELLAKQRFSGVATYGMNWGSTASSYQGVLHEAMRDFLDHAVPAIVAAAGGG